MIRAGHTIYIARTPFDLNFGKCEYSLETFFVKKVDTTGAKRVLIGIDGKRVVYTNSKRVDYFNRWFFSRRKAEAYHARNQNRSLVILASTPNNVHPSQSVNRLLRKLGNDPKYDFVTWQPTASEWEENERLNKILEQANPVCDLPFEKFTLQKVRNIDTGEISYMKVNDRVLKQIQKLRGTGINYRR